MRDYIPSGNTSTDGRFYSIVMMTILEKDDFSWDDFVQSKKHFRLIKLDLLAAPDEFFSGRQCKLHLIIFFALLQARY
jgi:hypothetical protein